MAKPSIVAPSVAWLMWPEGRARSQVKAVTNSSITVEVDGPDVPSPHQVVDVAAGPDRFQARAVPAGTRQLLLVLPAWMAATGNRRGAVRVAVDIDARWTPSAGGDALAARLVDLSVTGARFISERALGLRAPGLRAPGLPAGGIVDLHLPAGTARAEVRTVLDHEHPLLLLVGVRFVALPAPLRSWVSAEVTRRR